MDLAGFKSHLHRVLAIDPWAHDFVPFWVNGSDVIDLW